MAPALRALIVAQVASVAVLGAAVRSNPFAPWARGWGETVAALGFYPVFLGFPMAVAYASRRTTLAAWKRDALLLIEVALGVATLVAIFPAWQ